MEELSSFDHCDGFILQVLVIGGALLDHSFHYVWGCFQPFEEVVHCLPASYCVSCFPDQCLEVADVLVDEWELEVVSVKGRSSGFLFDGVRELGLEVVEKVGVGVFDVVFDGVELFYHLKHHFHPSVDFWPFDECKGDGNVSDW